MAYKTILVHIDNGKRCTARLDIALRLAKRFDAHLVGLHALTVAPIPAYAVAEGGHTVIELAKQRAIEVAKEAEKAFRSTVQKAGLPNAEWRASPNDAVGAVTLHARYADLVVIGQPEESAESGVMPAFAHQIVLTSGRPILAIPYAGKFDTLGERILLAWNGGREATRAATDAMPFLQTAREVTVMAVNPEGVAHGEEPGADIGLYLARHGVRVQVAAVKGSRIDAGNQILSRAADLSCDMLVMGAYGHSRLSELVLGGVTRTIFESMTVPVLMSH